MRKMLALTVGVLAAGPAAATTLVAMDIASLSTSAEAIVQARVVSQHSRWTGDHQRIVTDVELAVLETIKGATPATVVVTQLGGEVGEVGQRVEAVGTFKNGQEVLVFLSKAGPRYRLVGMAQGKFTVERSSDGQAAFAVPDRQAEALLLDATTRQPMAWQATAYPLEKLKADIRLALSRPTVSPVPRPPGKVVK